MTATRVLTYVEIDLDYCSLTYGTSPCTASVPTTGDAKCFNTLKTCQDRDNFDNEPVTYRFAVPTDYLPKDIACIPSISDVDVQPGRVSLGENLGERATVTITFTDHRHADAGEGFDKYLSDRGYDTYQRGTFFGRFRARHPYVRGRSLRLIFGELGQSLSEMETHHYVMESFSGPSQDGVYTIKAHDVLKLADGDRAQAPVPSSGFLVADIAIDATSATLSPTGIGNEEYPASGYANIGGKEIVSFTRSGDVLTLTGGRAALGTTAQEHSAQDRVQIVLRYDADDPADIIRDLLVNYAAVDADFIPLTTWQTETASFLARVYSATIANPTSVATLLSELIEQAALALWWDDVNQTIGLQVLRPIVTDAAIYDENMFLEDTFQAAEQHDRRLSKVEVLFGQINPLTTLTDGANFRSSAVGLDADAEADYGTAAIKTIYSRWIPAFGRTTATRLTDLLLSRFRDPPRRFTFALLRGTVSGLALAAGRRLMGWPIQDASGAATYAPVQITRLRSREDRIEVEADETLFAFTVGDPNEREIVIDSNINNLNLRTLHDSLYPEAVSGDVVILRVLSGILVGSTSSALPALDIGSWASGVEIEVVVDGSIIGAGGAAGAGSSSSAAAGAAGQPGGVALYTRHDIALSGEGLIGGGGGGGGGGGLAVNGFGSWFGGGGGGGGQGLEGGALGLGGSVPIPSQNGSPGQAGTIDDPGSGGAGGSGAGAGGNGGALGQAGSSGGGATTLGGAAGAAGSAIDGDSYVTETGTLDVQGPRVN